MVRGTNNVFPFFVNVRVFMVEDPVVTDGVGAGFGGVGSLGFVDAAIPVDEVMTASALVIVLPATVLLAVVALTVAFTTDVSLALLFLSFFLVLRMLVSKPKAFAAEKNLASLVLFLVLPFVPFPLLCVFNCNSNDCTRCLSNAMVANSCDSVVFVVLSVGMSAKVI